MQSGHNEIKRKENLRVSRVRVLTRMTGNFFVFKAERRAGDVVFVKLIFVFLTLNAEESEAKQHGENEAADHEPATSGLRAPDGEDDRQAAADQNSGVDAAQKRIDALAG